MSRPGREREAFPIAVGPTNEIHNVMTHAAQPISTHTPIMLSRIIHKPPTPEDTTARPHALLEEAVLELLRKHCPNYMKACGYDIRCALNRAFLRLMLERTRGNQARAAEIVGVSRSTIHKHIVAFGISVQAFMK